MRVIKEIPKSEIALNSVIKKLELGKGFVILVSNCRVYQLIHSSAHWNYGFSILVNFNPVDICYGSNSIRETIEKGFGDSSCELHYFNTLQEFAKVVIENNWR